MSVTKQISEPESGETHSVRGRVLAQQHHRKLFSDCRMNAETKTSRWSDGDQNGWYSQLKQCFRSLSVCSYTLLLTVHVVVIKNCWSVLSPTLFPGLMLSSSFGPSLQNLWEPLKERQSLDQGCSDLLVILSANICVEQNPECVVTENQNASWSLSPAENKHALVSLQCWIVLFKSWPIVKTRTRICPSRSETIWAVFTVTWWSSETLWTRPSTTRPELQSSTTSTSRRWKTSTWVHVHVRAACCDVL